MKVETTGYIMNFAVTLDLSEPVLVTHHGVPVYVIESFERYQEREDAIALLKLLTKSEKDKLDGNLYSKEQLLRI